MVAIALTLLCNLHWNHAKPLERSGSRFQYTNDLGFLLLYIVTSIPCALCWSVHCALAEAQRITLLTSSSLLHSISYSVLLCCHVWIGVCVTAYTLIYSYKICHFTVWWTSDNSLCSPLITSTSVISGTHLDRRSLRSMTLYNLNYLSPGLCGCVSVGLLVGSTGVVVAGRTVHCFAKQYQSVVF